MARGKPIYCEFEKARIGDRRCHNPVDDVDSESASVLNGRIVYLCSTCRTDPMRKPPGYPWWSYYPRAGPLPQCAIDFIDAKEWEGLEKRKLESNSGDSCLEQLRDPLLVRLGYKVVQSKKDKQTRGSRGSSGRNIEPDAVHVSNRVLLEIEGGDSAKGSRIERDLIRAALYEPSPDYLFVGVPRSHDEQQPEGKEGQRTNRSFRDARDLLDDIDDKSARINLKLRGVLLFGY